MAGTKVQVFRLNSSEYQDEDYKELEEAKINQIDDVTFLRGLSKARKDIPFILISNSQTQTDQIPTPLLDSCQLLIHPNSGHDNFGLNFVKSASFPIVLGNEIRKNAVTEYILSALFHHYCPLSDHKFWSDSRTFKRKLLRDSKCLIIGHGLIGSSLTPTLSSLCQEVFVYDPFDSGLASGENIKKIDQLSGPYLSQSDIVLITASLTNESFQLIDYNFLQKLPENFLLINSARGKIIKEKDLIDHLSKFQKSFAYLDVFENEPFPPGHMGSLKNVFKTSHIAGVSSVLNQDIIDFEYKVISDFIALKDQAGQFESLYKKQLLTEKSLYPPKL